MAGRVWLLGGIASLLLVASASAAVAGGGGHGGAGACPAIGEGSEVVLRDFCLDGTAHFLPEVEPQQLLRILRHSHLGGDHGRRAAEVIDLFGDRKGMAKLVARMFLQRLFR
jgi:hypothetical protein